MTLRSLLCASIKIDLAGIRTQDLSDFVTEKIVELLQSRSEVADLRRKCRKMESTVAKVTDKSAELEKRVRTLDLVVKKFKEDSKNGETSARPLIIHRSVGIQILPVTS